MKSPRQTDKGQSDPSDTAQIALTGYSTVGVQEDHDKPEGQEHRNECEHGDDDPDRG